MAYGPTTALINLGDTMRTELGPHGILVTVVNPGFVATPMTRDRLFPMPGIVPLDEAAVELLNGLKSGKFEIVFPRGFVYLLKSLRRMPNAPYFWMVRTSILPRTG